MPFYVQFLDEEYRVNKKMSLGELAKFLEEKLNTELDAIFKARRYDDVVEYIISYDYSIIPVKVVRRDP